MMVIKVSRMGDLKRLEYFSTGQVSLLTGTKQNTVLKWIADGSLKAHRIPGTRGDRRIEKQDLIAFLEEHQIPIPRELEESASALIVNEDEVEAQLVLSLIKNQFEKVVITTNAFDVGVQLERHSLKVVFMGLNMKMMNSYELIKYMKQQKEFSDICIVVMTSGLEEDLKRARKIGADGLLDKPLNPQKVFGVMKELDLVKEAS